MAESRQATDRPTQVPLHLAGAAISPPSTGHQNSAHTAQCRTCGVRRAELAADIRYRDSLAQTDQLEEEMYSLVLANPPFAGSLDYESTARDLLLIMKTKKTELLFQALLLRLLQPGGRAAVIVPDGVLFGAL